MATSYPGAIDTPTNPTSSNTLNSPSHSAQHALENDAIVALETKLGVDGSAVTTSVDYKLSGVPASDKAASKTGTETLTNKTLTSPAINIGSDATGDLYTRGSGGALQRVPVGSAGQILGVSAGLPAFIPNPAASNGSTTNTGVFQEATQSQVDAGTATGSTGADLVARTDTIRARNINGYVIDTGTANAYAIAPSPAITAYAMGQMFTFKAINTNTTASTLAVSALASPVPIKKNGTLALTGGEIVSGNMYTVIYDGTNFQILSQIPHTNFAQGQGTLSSTGDKTLTHSLGVIPKLIKITTTGVYNSADVGTCFGSATATGAQTSTQTVFNLSSNNLISNQDATHIIRLTYDNNTTVVILASITAITTTTVTLNVATASADSVNYQWEIYG